jgi:hypothetical protein
MKKSSVLITSSLALVLGSACGDETITLPDRLFSTTAATPAECPDGGETILTGIDANRNGALDDDEIQAREPVCVGPDGEPGEAGIPGTDALIRTLDELAGANCEVGGVRIDVGVDDDDDDVLDEDEVQQTSFACDGPEGEVGLVSLVAFRDDPGALCSDAGGIVVDSGVDLDRDGELDAEEVQSSEVVCEGEAGLSGLAEVSAEPPGANCSRGGQRVDSGLDQNGNGELDDTEVDNTSFICDVLPSLVQVVPEVAGVSTACPTEGGARIESGIDDNVDGILQPGEIDQSSVVCNQGTGLRTLTSVTPEPAGNNCPDGGNRVELGVDDDDDGVLQPGEIDQTSFVCNGLDGSDANPAGGNAVRVQAEPAGANCTNGGVAIQTGPDTNDNGALDDAEVTSTTYSCEGSGTQALATITDEPAGMNCPNGGVRVDSGPDTNGNGTLDPAEQGTPQFVCNAVPTTQVPFFITTESLPNGIDTRDYDATLTAVGGGGGGYQWSIVAGALPPGFVLDPTGTPSSSITGAAGTMIGVYNFTVRVTDFFGNTTETAFTLEVTGPPCAPGQNGVVGSASAPVPVSVVGGIPGPSFTGEFAADTSTAGWTYFIAPGVLARVSKDGATQQNLLTSIPGLSGTDAGREIQFVGNDIYIASQSTGTTRRVLRISTDGGATFSVQDMVTFPAGVPGSVRGIFVDGSTMFMLMHNSADVALLSANIGGSLPATAVELIRSSDVGNCSGLAGDSVALFTACGTERLPPPVNDDPVLRLDRANLSVSVFFNNISTFNVDDSDINSFDTQDVDGDGIAEILFIDGEETSDDKFYFCNPSTGIQFFEELYPNTTTDRGFGLDTVNGVLWLFDRAVNNLYRAP